MAEQNDPRVDPVGTVRRHESGRTAVKVSMGDNTGKGSHVWVRLDENLESWWMHHADVRNWSVVSSAATQTAEQARPDDELIEKTARMLYELEMPTGPFGSKRIEWGTSWLRPAWEKYRARARALADAGVLAAGSPVTDEWTQEARNALHAARCEAHSLSLVLDDIREVYEMDGGIPELVAHTAREREKLLDRAAEAIGNLAIHVRQDIALNVGAATLIDEIRELRPGSPVTETTTPNADQVRGAVKWALAYYNPEHGYWEPPLAEDADRVLGADLHTEIRALFQAVPVTETTKQAESEDDGDGFHCCMGPFADGSHATYCRQRCQDCKGDPDGPFRCRCRDLSGVTSETEKR